MNCAECKELLVLDLEGLLDHVKEQAVREHLKDCPSCQAELQGLQTLQERLVKNGKALAQSNLEDKVLERIVRERNMRSKTATGISTGLKIRRIIMKSRITKLATAAVIIAAVALSISLFNKSVPTASAVEVLSKAREAMGKLKSVYIKLQIRTLPRDNFELIGLDYDFVANEIWKEFDGTIQGKWRIEKPGRVVTMDGQSSLLLIRPNFAVKGGVNTGFVGWLRPLLNVDQLLDSEIKLAQEQGSELVLTREKGADGRDKLVIVVEASAQGDFTNDWLKNKSIPASDNCRIYTFDAKTKLLEGLEVYIHAQEKDVLVLKTTDIVYNVDIEPDLFALELPEDVIWDKPVEVLADNLKYQQMTPHEAAQAFFQACANEDWDEFLKFSPRSAVSQGTKDFLGGLEIISLGEPFKSGQYPGWFVPYEIKVKSGQVRKHNLAIRNDNPAKRYVVDGGI